MSSSSSASLNLGLPEEEEAEELFIKESEDLHDRKSIEEG